MLDAVHVDLGVGEVRDAARVVDVEMGHDDVANVGALEAEPLDLANRGVFFTEAGSTQRDEPRPEAIVRFDDERVDDHLSGSEEGASPAVDEPATERAHRAEVEVMDLHSWW